MKTVSVMPAMFWEHKKTGAQQSFYTSFPKKVHEYRLIENGYAVKVREDNGFEHVVEWAATEPEAMAKARRIRERGY